MVRADLVEVSREQWYERSAAAAPSERAQPKRSEPSEVLRRQRHGQPLSDLPSPHKKESPRVCADALAEPAPTHAPAGFLVGEGSRSRGHYRRKVELPAEWKPKPEHHELARRLGVARKNWNVEKW